MPQHNMPFLPDTSTLGQPSSFARLQDGNSGSIGDVIWNTLQRNGDVIANPSVSENGVRESFSFGTEDGFDAETARTLLSEEAYGLIQQRERRRGVEWGKITDNMAQLNRHWVEPLIGKIKIASTEELGRLLTLFHYYDLNGGGWALRMDATANDIDSVFSSLGWDFLVPNE